MKQHTQYAYAPSGIIAKLGSRPNWLDDEGNPVTDAVLAEHGWLPVDYTQPDHDPRLRRVSLNPQSEWAIESKRVVATYTVHDIPLETLRADKLQQATAMRWQVMTGGLTLPNGVQIGTTDDDHNRITAVVVGAPRAGLTTDSIVSFKAASGFVKLTIGQIEEIMGLIGQHWQACFAAEEAHYLAIEALETREAIAAYDVSQGWPQ